MAKAKNLASGRLYQNISASTTTLLVYVGNGSSTTIKNVWPSVPFYATISPSSPVAGTANSLDSEIVKVTAVGNDQIGNTSLTVVRGQRGVTAKAFSAGAIVTHAIYAEDGVFLDDPTTLEEESPWIDTDMIEDEAVTGGKIDWNTMVQAGRGDTISTHRLDFGKFHMFMGYTGGAAGSGKTLSIDLPADWVSHATMYNSIVLARTYYSYSSDTTFGAYWFGNGKAQIYQINGNASYGNPTQILCIGWW